MDAALTVAVALGSALLGVVGGFWGALRLEQRKENQRRRGLIVALHTDLSDNAVKGRGLLERLKHREAGPLWDSAGPVSAEFWQAMIVEAGAFLPFDLFFKMRIAYEELPFFKTFGDNPQEAPHQDVAVQLLQQWVKLLEDIQDEVLQLSEARSIRNSVPQAFKFIRDRAASKKELRQDAVEGEHEVKQP